jgi:ATP-dependent Clp protease ATP-binding subunit ClpC
VILFDEVEKAHPDVFNLLLQALDEGYMTDSGGRKIDFRNSVIIMTSNIGSRQLKDFGTGVGFGTHAREANKDRDTKGVVETQLKKFFSPEFLNRIDDIIVFNSLEKNDIIKILDIRMARMLKRIEDLGYKITITDSAKSFLADKGFDADFGARPLQRALQKHLEETMAEKVLQGILKEGDTMVVDYTEGAEDLSITVANQLSLSEGPQNVDEIIQPEEAPKTKGRPKKSDQNG